MPGNTTNNDASLQLLMEQFAGNSAGANSIDLEKILRRISYRPKLIIIITLVITALTIPIVLRMQNVYEVRTVLAPVDSDKASRLAALSSQIGAAFDPAALLLGAGGGSNKTNKALATLKSHRFLTEFIREHNVKRFIFADRWDKKNSRWKKKQGVFSSFSDKKTDSPESFEPKDVTAYNRFVKKIMSVDQDRKTGLVSLSIRFTDRDLALAWAQALPDKLNEYYRSKERREAELSIGYLQNQIEKTSLVDMQKMLYDLIQRYTQTIMLASTSKEFIFEVIDPPYTPDKPISPNRVLLVLLAAIGGLILGSIASYITCIRNEKQISPGGKS